MLEQNATDLPYYLQLIHLRQFKYHRVRCSTRSQCIYILDPSTFEHAPDAWFYLCFDHNLALLAFGAVS